MVLGTPPHYHSYFPLSRSLIFIPSPFTPLTLIPLHHAQARHSSVLIAAPGSLVYQHFSHPPLVQISSGVFFVVLKKRPHYFRAFRGLLTSNLGSHKKWPTKLSAGHGNFYLRRYTLQATIAQTGIVVVPRSPHRFCWLWRRCGGGGNWFTKMLYDLRACSVLPSL